VGCRQTIWETESTGGWACAFISKDERGWVGANGTDASDDDETESGEIGGEERAGREAAICRKKGQTKRGTRRWERNFRDDWTERKGSVIINSK